MQVTAGLKLLLQQLHEFRLDQAPFMVSLLVPGIWKENLHPVQALVCNTLT